MDGPALARIGCTAHLPIIETGIGPSETKAERPARKKGFWNRNDAMAKAARWRDEKRKAFGRTKFQTVETARAQNRQAGLPVQSLGWHGVFGQSASCLKRWVDVLVSELPGGRERSSDRNRPLVEPAPARAPGDDIATYRFRPTRSFGDIRR